MAALEEVVAVFAVQDRLHVSHQVADPAVLAEPLAYNNLASFQEQVVADNQTQADIDHKRNFNFQHFNENLSANRFT